MWDKFWLVMTPILMVYFSVKVFYMLMPEHQNWFGVMYIIFIASNAGTSVGRIYDYVLKHE